MFDLHISTPSLFVDDDFINIIESEYNFELKYLRNRSITSQIIYQVTVYCYCEFLVIGCPVQEKHPNENDIYEILCSDIVNDYISLHYKKQQWFSNTVLLLKGRTFDDFSCILPILDGNILSSYLFRKDKELLLICDLLKYINKDLVLCRLCEVSVFKEVNPLLLKHYLEYSDKYRLLINGDALSKIKNLTVM